MELKALLFVSLLTLTSLFADTSTTDAEFRGEAKAKITFLEKQNVEIKIKLDSLEDKQKSVEEYKNIIDRQDKRVEDVNSKMSVAGVIVAFLAIIIGIGGVVFPIVLFRQNTKIQEQAKSDIVLWKEKTKKEFDEELEKFKQHANTKTEEITQEAENVHKIREKIEQSSDISKLGNDISSEEQELASYESQKLATKAKKTSSWKDYITSAKLSFFAKNYGDALRSINEALHELKKIENTEAIKEQIVKALVNKGVTLGQLDKSEEAIKVYDELFHTFKDTSNEAIKEQIANALLNIFEYLLINNQEWNDEQIKLYKQYTKDNKQLLLEFKMLKILKNALEKEQIHVIEQLKDKFSDTDFGDWNWKELERWVITLQGEQKERVQKAIEVFKNWNK